MGDKISKEDVSSNENKKPTVVKKVEPKVTKTVVEDIKYSATEIMNIQNFNQIQRFQINKMYSTKSLSIEEWTKLLVIAKIL